MRPVTAALLFAHVVWFLGVLALAENSFRSAADGTRVQIPTLTNFQSARGTSDDPSWYTQDFDVRHEELPYCANRVAFLVMGQVRTYFSRRMYEHHREFARELAPNSTLDVFFHVSPEEWARDGSVRDVGHLKEQLLAVVPETVWMYLDNPVMQTWTAFPERCPEGEVNHGGVGAQFNRWPVAAAGVWHVEANLGCRYQWVVRLRPDSRVFLPLSFTLASLSEQVVYARDDRVHVIPGQLMRAWLQSVPYVYYGCWDRLTTLKSVCPPGAWQPYEGNGCFPMLVLARLLGIPLAKLQIKDSVNHNGGAEYVFP